MGYGLQLFGSSSPSGTVAILGLTVALLLTAYRMLRAPGKSKLPLPPGPPSEPILGHYRVVPEDAAFKQYAEWAKEYSTASKGLFFGGKTNTWNSHLSSPF